MVVLEPLIFFHHSFPSTSLRELNEMFLKVASVGGAAWDAAAPTPDPFLPLGAGSFWG